MRKIAWMSVVAAVAATAGVAWGRGRVDYSEVTAESLVTSPQASWARAILFTDEVVAPPSANWKRLDRKNYASMQLRTVGTVWIPEGKVSAFDGVQPGRLYSFGGTVDQFSRRYYVILDAVFELQTEDDLSAHWTGMLDGDAGEDDPALQGVLLQVQNRLIQMAKEQGVTVAQLVEAQTDGGQRLAQVVAAEAMQSEFRAKNTTAEEVLIDSVLARLQKQAVSGGGEAVAGDDAAEDNVAIDGWDETVDEEAYWEEGEDEYGEEEEEEYSEGEEEEYGEEEDADEWGDEAAVEEEPPWLEEEETEAAARAAAAALQEKERAEAEARKAAEIARRKRAAEEREAAEAARAKEKARLAEEKRLQQEAEKERAAAARAAKAEAERLAREKRRAAEEAKSRKAAQSAADFWSRPVSW